MSGPRASASTGVPDTNELPSVATESLFSSAAGTSPVSAPIAADPNMIFTDNRGEVPLPLFASPRWRGVLVLSMPGRTAGVRADQPVLHESWFHDPPRFGRAGRGFGRVARARG